MNWRGALLMLLAALPAFAQFELQVVDATGAHAAPSTCNLGAVYAGETASARFILHNSSAGPAIVQTIAAAGPGFSAVTPVLPARVDPQAALEFQVDFRAADTGSYSAVLRAENITILLVANVLPRLTYRVEGAPTGPTIDFGVAVVGSSATRRITALNDTPTILIVPAIAVSGAGFSFAGPPVSGISLRPHQSVEFVVEFQPAQAGRQTGTLVLGDRSYALQGAGVDPPLPNPIVSIQLAQAASAEQGTLIVNFDRPAAASGVGTATLEFEGPSDSAIAFAAGGRTAAFTIQPGDTGVVLPFQTGTTAGTIRLRVRIGDSADETSITIPKAAPAFSTVEGSRYGSSLEIRVTGFDNARTAGPLVFTFFDAAGQEITPGALRVDASAEFANYFAVSGGGAFVLRAMFAVTGDASKIAAFEAALSNSEGSSRSARTPFP